MIGPHVLITSVHCQGYFLSKQEKRKADDI